MRGRSTLVVISLIAGCKSRPPLDARVEADGYYLQAQNALLANDFALAHQSLAKVRELNAADPRLPVAEGEVYLSEAKFDEALTSFEAATRLDRSRALAWSRLAYLYALKKKPELAAAAATEALALNSSDFNALEVRADLEYERGDLEGAVQTLERAARVAPPKINGELLLKATTWLSQRQRQRDALTVLSLAWDAGVRTPEVAQEFGDRLVESSQLESAIDAYTVAAEGTPADPSLWELVGELERRQGRTDRAEAAFRRSLAQKDRSVVHAELARVFLDRKERALALAELDRALELASGESLRESLELADLLATVGRKNDSLVLLKTLADEPDQHANVELQLKVAQLATELKDSATAKTACSRALAAHASKCPTTRQ